MTLLIVRNKFCISACDSLNHASDSEVESVPTRRSCVTNRNFETMSQRLSSIYTAVTIEKENYLAA